MEIVYILLAALAGAGMPVQAGVNSQLQQAWAGNSILAAAASFAVGTVALLVLVLVLRIPIPSLGGKTALWHWAGGVMGAYFVAIMAFLAPRLGSATLIGFVLAGQLCISLALDHFGLLGYAQKAITWQRVVGILFVGCGVFLVRRF